MANGLIIHSDKDTDTRHTSPQPMLLQTAPPLLSWLPFILSFSAPLLPVLLLLVLLCSALIVCLWVIPDIDATVCPISYNSWGLVTSVGWFCAEECALGPTKMPLSQLLPGVTRLGLPKWASISPSFDSVPCLGKTNFYSLLPNF